MKRRRTALPDVSNLLPPLLPQNVPIRFSPLSPSGSLSPRWMSKKNYHVEINAAKCLTQFKNI